MTAKPAMDPRTYVPRGANPESLTRLRSLLGAAPGAEPSTTTEHPGPVPTVTLAAGTQSVELPAHLVEALRLIVGALADGRPVTVSPHEHMVTPHEASEFLHLSRARLDHLMETGQLPFRAIGRHHRILLADVLSYHRRVHGDEAGLTDDADD